MIQYFLCQYLGSVCIESLKRFKWTLKIVSNFIIDHHNIVSKKSLYVELIVGLPILIVASSMLLVSWSAELY